MVTSTPGQRLTVNPSNGFAGQMALSVTGLQSGVTATFSPNPGHRR